MSKINIVRQTTQNECGLCCICMAASFYGFKQPLSYYRMQYNIGRDGLNIKAIVDVIKKLKLNANVYQVKSLNSYSFSKAPYIAFVNNNHYVVIKKLSKDRLTVYDPSKGVERIKIDNFQIKFSGYLIEVTEGIGFVKKKASINDFRHITKIVLEEKKALITLSIMSMFIYSISLLIPIILQNVINSFSNNTLPSYFSYKVIYVTIVLLCFFVLSNVRNNWMIKIQKRLYNQITLKTIQHLFKVNYSFFDNRSQGDILFRINLLSQIQAGISSSLLQVILAIAFISALLAIIFYKYNKTFHIFLILFLIISIMVIYVNRKISILKQAEFRSKRNAETIITEIVSNMFQIRCLNLSQNFMKMYKDSYTEFIEQFEKSQKKTYKYNLYFNVIFSYLPIYLIILFIALPFFNKYTIGELFALYSLLGMFFSQCLALVSEIINIYMLKANIFYFNDMIDEPELEQKGNVNILKINKLEIINVGFKYSSLSKLIIKNINIKVYEGQKIAIVGLSGSGKTTIIKMLARLYNPTEGKILINNINLNLIDDKIFNSLVSVVPQIPVYFNKTVRENVTMNDKRYSEKDVKKALKIANILEDIEKMPLGIDTMVSGQGGNLSGGQIQRLAIARAVISHPELLIMDEATSSLDSWNEKIIYDNLKQMNITQIVISHRLSTIKDSDYIYCINGGIIVEEGNHEQLTSNKGYYWKLFIEKNIEIKI